MLTNSTASFRPIPKASWCPRAKFLTGLVPRLFGEHCITYFDSQVVCLTTVTDIQRSPRRDLFGVSIRVEFNATVVDHATIRLLDLLGDDIVSRSKQSDNVLGSKIRSEQAKRRADAGCRRHQNGRDAEPLSQPGCMHRSGTP